MIRIFLDSSVFFSAAYSATGHSRDLFLLAARGEISLVISPLVEQETRQNLIASAPKAVAYFEVLLHSIPFEHVSPTQEEVIAAAREVVWKDAPIVAAAKKAAVDLLVSLDRKHILGKPNIAAYARMPVLSPKEAIEWIQTRGKQSPSDPSF